MAITGKNILKGWFQKGLKPSASQFADWMDSFWHKNETIPVSSVQGLQDVIRRINSRLNALDGQTALLPTEAPTPTPTPTPTPPETDGPTPEPGQPLPSPTAAQQIWYSAEINAEFVKNSCGSGYAGSTVGYTVPQGKYSSTVSQADANAKAQADIAANGQAYANANGTCTLIPTQAPTSTPTPTPTQA